MINLIVSIQSLFLFSSLSAAQLPSHYPNVNFIVNIHTGSLQQQSNPVANSTTTHAFSSNDLTGASVDQANPLELSLPLPIQPAMNPSLPVSSSIWITPPHLCYKNIILGSIVGTYLGLWVTYLWYASSIHSKKSWAAWRNGIPLEELYQLPLEHIRNKFISALTRKYGKEGKSAMTASLFYRFEQDIAHELSMLHNYLRFYNFLQITRLRLVLPNQEILHQKAHNSIQRLEFLQNIAEQIASSIITTPQENIETSVTQKSYFSPESALN